MRGSQAGLRQVVESIPSAPQKPTSISKDTELGLNPSHKCGLYQVSNQLFIIWRHGLPLFWIVAAKDTVGIECIGTCTWKMGNWCRWVPSVVPY